MTDKQTVPDALNRLPEAALLDEGSDSDAEAAWDTELARRAEEIRSGRASGEPTEKVFSELRAKHS